MLTWRKLAFLFLIGAPLASVGDMFHVHTHTTFYPPQGAVWFIKGMPFWIPFVFGVAAAFLGITYQLAKGFLGAKRFKQGSNLIEVVVAGLVYSLLHITSGYISHWSFPFPDVALALPVILIWSLLDRSFGGALVCIFAAFIGVSAEIFLVHMGVFSFSDSANQLCGVATWLGWIYMAGALAIERFVERSGPMKPLKLEYKSHPIYSKKPSKVYIVEESNKRHCLEEAVQRSGFITHLNNNWKKSDKPKEEFRIAIKPNFMCTAYKKDISVYTDVELVEHLIEMIRNEGYRDIVVVESQMVWSLFREDRTVENVARMLGYFPSGYRIMDMTIEKEENYDYPEPLGSHPFSPTWRYADYRISFAKNKTHFQCHYTGCMKNIYGCLPEQDKLKSYHGTMRNREFQTCTIVILEAFPVDFAFLDAYFSGDGLAGLIRDNDPNETNTIICGENCFAVDWVQGQKMGVNPEKNYVIRRAKERWGKPEIQTDGPMAPYKNWHNVWPYMDTIADHIEEHYHLSRFVCYILGYRMDERFKLVNNWTCFCSTPFRKLLQISDEYSWLIYPILVCKLLLVDFYLLWRLFGKGG